MNFLESVRPLLNQGKKHLERRNLKRANELFTQAHKICDEAMAENPKNPEAYIWWVKSARALGNYYDASVCLDRAVDLFRDHGRILAMWIKDPSAITLNLETLDKSEIRYQSVISRIQHPYIYTIGAYVAFKRSDFQTASERIKQIPEKRWNSTLNKLNISILRALSANSTAPLQSASPANGYCNPR